MIVDNSNIERIAAFKPENDAPLIIDTNRVETLPAAFERLQAVPRRHPQIAQLRRIMQVKNFAAARAKQLSGKSPRLFGLPVVEQVFGQAVSKGFDHVSRLSELDNFGNSKRGKSEHFDNSVNVPSQPKKVRFCWDKFGTVPASSRGWVGIDRDTMCLFHASTRQGSQVHALYRPPPSR